MDKKQRDIELAREIGFNTEHPATNEYLHRFADLIREDCAKVCDEAHARYKELWEKFDYAEDQGRALAALDCAAAIRARGQA